MVASMKLMKDKNIIITKDVIKSDVEDSPSFGGLNLGGTLCDYEIICEDKKFSCHKAVLATNSKVFEVFTYICTLIHKYSLDSRIPKMTYLAPRTAVIPGCLAWHFIFTLI